MIKLKLSQLADDVEVSNDGSLSILTAGELKDEVARFGNEQTGQWFTVKPKKWQPDARHMIEVYIENQEVEMYEGWDERAMDCVSGDLPQKMQNLLDEAFKGDSVTAYWEWHEPFEIDISPNK